MIKKIKFLEDEAKVIIKNENEFIQKHWNLNCFYEAKGGALLGYINKNIKKGGKYIDIGASIGNHTIFLAEIMKGKEIYSFEPLLSSFNHLIENVELNNFKNVKCFNYALGEDSGRVSMQNINENQIGMTQVVKGNDVELKKIDDFDFFENYDYIKIDVEHYNKEVLNGAKETFTKGIGIISIEAETNEQLKEVDEIMKTYKYIRELGTKLNSTPTYIYRKIK